MKKTLLMLVAFMATMTAFAQDEQEGWMKSFAPVADASDLAGIHTAVAGDGSVYASSTYNQVFQFAGKAVTDPEGLTSSCVVKYDKDGNELWAVSLAGKCKVYAMTADTDGTLYVAGSSADEKVIVTGTDKKTHEIVNPTKEEWGEIVVAGESAFLIKVSAAGVVENLTTIEPAGPESNYYGEAFVRPNKLVLDNGLLYVSCFYQGAVSSFGWEGRYVTMLAMLDFDTFETMYFGDIPSAGLFTVKATDLSENTGLANVLATTDADMLDDNALQCGPKAFDFVVYNGVPHIAFIGWGYETLNTTSGEPKNFEFKMEGEGKNEHALVLANVNDLNKTIVFHAEAHDYLGATYNLVGAALAGDNCILGGTFYGNFPLDNTVTKDKNTSFVASIKMSDCSVNWATPNTVESEATCMIVAGAEIHASTTVGTYTIKTDKGTIDEEETMAQVFDDCAVYNDTYCSTIFTEGANVVVYSPHMNPSGIEAVKTAAAKGEMKIFNLNGQRVAKPQKGLYIINGTKVAIK